MRQIIFDGKAVLADSSYPPEAWIVSADGRHEINKTVRELRQQVGLVYRGVDIRMQSTMRVPWQLRQGDNVLWYSEDDSVPDNFAWLEDLPDYIGLIEACLCLTSQAFIYKQSNRSGVRGLQWFSPLSVAPEWDETAGLKHFERRLSSTVSYYAPDDIVYVWRRDPLHETMPDTAPAQAAMASANVLYSIDQFVTGFFQRGAIKPMLLQVPQNTPQAERDKVKAWWDRFFSGVKDAWRTNVVSTEVKPVVVGEGLESLTNETLTQERRDDVATAIGVPHSLLFSNSANYATAKQDEQNFYTMTILPDVRLIQKQLNAQLFKALGLQLRFMPNEMDVFQEDEAARAQSFATYVGAGMKQSVAAQILGVELPDGVEYADLDPDPPPAPVIVQQMPPEQPQAQPASEETTVDDEDVQSDADKAVEVATFKRWLKKRPKADPCEFKSAILTDDEKHTIADDVRGEVAPEESFFTLPDGGITHDWLVEAKALILRLDPNGDDEAEQKIRKELEKRAERELRRAFQEMKDTLYPAGWDTDNPQLEQVRIHNAFLRDQKLRDTVSRMLQDGADLGVSFAIDSMANIGLAFDYTLMHQVARDWALKYTDDLLNQLGTTSGRLTGQAVARWYENGEPLSALLNDLEPVFGKRRARTIGVTESTRAASEGTIAAYTESGLAKSRPSIVPPTDTHVGCRCWLTMGIRKDNSAYWIFNTARDEIVARCPICSPLHGKEV
jgi:HK97 family phage portal protein